MKVYRGYSDRDDAVGGPENTIATVTDEAGTRPLPPMEQGFSWGYEGAGPQNLAAAILVDHLGLSSDYQTYLAEDRNFFLAGGFMRAVVAAWPQGGGWALAESQVAAWLQEPLAPCVQCRTLYDVATEPADRCPACTDLERHNGTECRCGHARGEHLGAWTADVAQECDAVGCTCQRFEEAA